MCRARRSPPAVAQRSWRRRAVSLRCRSTRKARAKRSAAARCRARAVGASSTSSSWTASFSVCLLRTLIRRNKNWPRCSPTGGFRRHRRSASVLTPVEGFARRGRESCGIAHIGLWRSAGRAARRAVRGARRDDVHYAGRRRAVFASKRSFLRPISASCARSPSTTSDCTARRASSERRPTSRMTRSPSSSET